MKNTAILYGSNSGNTESVAKRIAKMMGVNDVFDVANFNIVDIQKYENLILGSSTLGFGDLQDDWEDFLPELGKENLTGKTIALFGLGDGYCYNDTFVDAIGIIYNALKNSGAKFVGEIDASEYECSDSAARLNGKFVGLPIDEDNESDKTEERINNWIESITPYFQ